MIRRHCPARRFVWPFKIVFPTPLLGASLRAAQGAGRRIQGLGFTDAVHLFVRPILFGLSRLDEFHADAQPCPPRAQPRQPQGPGRTEGRPIIGPDYLRQAISLEKPLQYQARARHVLPRQPVNSRNVAAAQIPDRQRFQFRAVTGAKPTLETEGPNLVGPPRAGQGRPAGRRSFAGTPPPFSGESPPLEPAADRRRGEQSPPAKTLRERPMYFRCAPTGMLPLAPPQAGQPFWLRTIMQRVRRVRLLPPPAPSAFLKMAEPFTRCFPTDSGASAMLGHTPWGAQN